jgi:aminoglycoside phosphotransferase (APT) family kinase protein
MHEGEVAVDDATVRALVDEEFPDWAELPLRRIADSGTDNAIYRLGESMGLRLPRIHWAEAQIDKELRWLSRLAGELPVPLPVPLAAGRPGHGYPFPWLVYPWIEGTSLDRVSLENWEDLARDVAEFVLALERVPTTDGPPPNRRGTPMAQYDSAVRRGLDQIRGVIDTDRAERIWLSALAAGDWPGDAVWVHGDLLPGNLLVHHGRLCGVIDWSGAGVGDPACDAMLAWSLPPDSRRTFRQALGFDDGTWPRARGWVVEQTVLYIPYYQRTLPRAVEQAKQRLHAALNEDG